MELEKEPMKGRDLEEMLVQQMVPGLEGTMEHLMEAKTEHWLAPKREVPWAPC